MLEVIISLTIATIDAIYFECYLIIYFFKLVKYFIDLIFNRIFIYLKIIYEYYEYIYI